MLIGLDFETYGDVSLPDHGLDRYVKGEHFRPLIAHTYYLKGGRTYHDTFDFVKDGDAIYSDLFALLQGHRIAAHNAPFEEAVLEWMGFDTDSVTFIDTAVLARAHGFGGSLEAAAPQALDVDKMEDGKRLIKLFSIPGVMQEANESLAFDPDIVATNPEDWGTFHKYCYIDAYLSYRLAYELPGLSDKEWSNNQITNRMNQLGWPVDLDSVHNMQQRYKENLEENLRWFYDTYQPGVPEDERLNFRSFPQLKEFCAARGVKARSFDELHVKKMLKAIAKKREAMGYNGPKNEDLRVVAEMLTLKQELGGSSLSKLQTIIDQTSEDGRLRNQYLHVGAGQTYRTSGRGVQMQNLKRLIDAIDMDDLEDVDIMFTNEVLAQNIRQVFHSCHPLGFLIVGDFSSVESRGLAWLARAEWKLDEFRKGKDMYKVLAAKIDGVHYDDVLKDRRQFGKVGELSCGYGAGGDAVRQFAEKMGTDLSEVEAALLVREWRAVNPEIERFWYRLDDQLHKMLADRNPSVTYRVEAGAPGWRVELQIIHTPASLRKQAKAEKKNVNSFELRLVDDGGGVHVRRVFHGAYLHGRNIRYFKPSERKTGDLWRDSYINPKTKQLTYYTVYGGKLTGILTQSMCREMFFNSLRIMDQWLTGVYGPTNLQMIGQFHDEIVLDWQPVSWASGRTIGLEGAKRELEAAMTNVGPFIGFPLDAEIKHDHRYTK